MSDTMSSTSSGTTTSASPRGLGRRTFLGRSLGLAAGAALGGSALAACASSTSGGSGSGGGGSSATGTITIMGDAGDHPEELLASFTDETGTQVEFLQNDFTRLSAMIAAGNPPDLVKGLGTTDPLYLVARDLALPLDDYIAQSDLVSTDDFLPVQDLWRVQDGKQGSGPVYGMVKDYSQDSMHWVNLGLYEGAGVAPISQTEPTPYDQLLETAKGLTASANGQTSTYGLGGYNDIGMGWLSQQIATFGGSFFSEDGSSVDFSTPEGQRILQWWLDLVAADVSYNPVNPAPDGWDASVYQAGRIATYMSGYWFQGMIAEDPAVRAESVLVPAPVFGSQRVSPTAAATSHWIPKGSANPDGAWSYLEWYSAGQPAKDRASSGWGLPALRSLSSLVPTDTLEYQQSAEAMQREEQYFAVVPWTPYVKIDAFETVLKQEFKRAITDGSSGGQLADALNGSLNPLIADERSKVS